MSCKCAIATDEYHGYECDITGGACMFLSPNSKICAEKYGEGPDAECSKGFEDSMTKYECSDCGKQFILGDAAIAGLPPLFPICPYCGQSNVEWRTKAKVGDIEGMGCMAIWTEGSRREERMKAIVQISISHSNPIDLRKFLEKIKIAAEEMTEDYMQEPERYKSKTIEIEIESFTRLHIN